ncbi:thiol peroxidase [Candidatus Proelusimicrobium excrementi]|uniref:thiol peroxidase n=1 Tax=Candidatus Proelusimicrobium excrementi TaxID=3416222 RepID=UPI003C9EB95A|nr:thiol peroxidase [Elusimicrobiaceae bacterium]
MSREITLNGNKFSLSGAELNAGLKAPDFTLAANDLSDVSLKDFKGRIVVLSAVPSLDTPTCSIETAHFNKEAGKLGDKVKILTVSKDLPFAQARWCAAQGIKNLQTLSDYKNTSFSQDYGLLIKGLYLLTRAVFVIDGEGVIRYVQFVKEVSNEPDYKAVLDAVNELI